MFVVGGLTRSRGSAAAASGAPGAHSQRWSRLPSRARRGSSDSAVGDTAEKPLTEGRSWDAGEGEVGREGPRSFSHPRLVVMVRIGRQSAVAVVQDRGHSGVERSLGEASALGAKPETPCSAPGGDGDLLVRWPAEGPLGGGAYAGAGGLVLSLWHNALSCPGAEAAPDRKNRPPSGQVQTANQ